MAMKKKNGFGQQIWEAIKTAQGFAIIRDDIIDLSDKNARKKAERAFYWFKDCVSILKKKLK